MRILFVEKIYPPNVIQFAFARVCVYRDCVEETPSSCAGAGGTCHILRRLSSGVSRECMVYRAARKRFPRRSLTSPFDACRGKGERNTRRARLYPFTHGGGAKNARNGNHPPSTKSYHRSFAFFFLLTLPVIRTRLTRPTRPFPQTRTVTLTDWLLWGHCHCLWSLPYERRTTHGTEMGDGMINFFDLPVISSARFRRSSRMSRLAQCIGRVSGGFPSLETRYQLQI